MTTTDCYDNNEAMGDDAALYDPDSNLSISLDSFFKILDEDPNQPPPPIQVTPDILHQDRLAPSSTTFEKTAEPQSDIHAPTPVTEDLKKLESFRWDSSGSMESFDCKKETGREYLYGYEGSCNNFNDMNHPLPADSGNFNTLGHDGSRFGSLPSNHSPDWLRPSSSEDSTCFMDTAGGSFDDSVPINFNYQLLPNNMPKFGVSPEKAEGEGFFYPPYADVDNGYLNNGQEMDYMPTDGETSSQVGIKGSKMDANDNVFFMLQNGGKDLSHAMMMENSGFGEGVHVGMHVGAVSDSRVQNCAAGSVYSSAGPGTVQLDRLHAEANITCKASDSLSFLGRDSTTNGGNVPRHGFPVQYFQPFLSCENKATIQWKDENADQELLLQNSYMNSETKLKEEPLDISKRGASVIDLEVPLSAIPNPEHSYCEDSTFNSESSTDSSQVQSTQYTIPYSSGWSVVNTEKQLVHDSKTVSLGKKRRFMVKEEAEVPASYRKQQYIPVMSNNYVQKYSWKSSSSADDDADVCILDDISDPVRPSPSSVNINLLPTLQRPVFNDPHYHVPGGIGLKTDDERLTFRIALQDLSQPRSEASPPEGVLAVPLLRHQRIALSWMVQKEKTSSHCSGGILADDQGLGKTISTIALILTERSPPPKSCSVAEKMNELEPLNLDDDDDDDDDQNGVSEINSMTHPQNSSPNMMIRPIKQENSVMVVKGRPAAGTLVVCPTSVLRQWADELKNKVTSEANISFLVYHGGNRTRDPSELAKYDVVLTTYAIVSMEVPKQSLVDKDGEEKGKMYASQPPSGLLASKKRKKTPDSTMKSNLLEATARPLAKVGWFRVILDEAQSIKNHRTQVARACWGLRAKRRWCLSGTPIQNAIDDLYSYFRFLRFEPYAVYNSFCSTIKMPISRDPTNGYKKLQAVLKTIMLRRTKGTLIDGKPVIILPPKTITLKKVDFSEKERAFYSTLESESQEQFKEYAAAGTVKENYVNILLMLLRLRQACDHPHLVKGYDSIAIGRSSIETSKKLPRDKQINLLSCLKSSLAICTICNDSPEDAVVTICGHVFCNQCICEHLSGDDNICPSVNCKVRLDIASVFSRGTLDSCLSSLPDHECSSADHVSHMVNTPMMHEYSLSYASSKIKAALEIIQSLPSSTVTVTSTGSLENLTATVPESCSVDISESKNRHANICPKTQATEKAIIFSQWTRMLDLLEVPLKDSCIQYRRLDGTMSVVAREKAVKEFNTLPEVTVMIMSLKAASLGLNMVAACHVLLLDLWWNPTTEDQAIDRAHRIGQTRPVTVSRLTVKDTVEDRILALQEKKREMVASAFGEDESGARQTRLTVEDLKYLFMGYN